MKLIIFIDFGHFELLHLDSLPRLVHVFKYRRLKCPLQHSDSYVLRIIKAHIHIHWTLEAVSCTGAASTSLSVLIV